MKRNHAGSGTSGLLKDFSTLSRRHRAARIISPELPKPRKAFIDRDGYLTWTWYASVGAERKPATLRKFPATLCFDFAGLADGSNEQIRLFAEKSGPLGLELRAEEQVELWRRYMRLARALLRFVGERRIGGDGKDEDWRTICEFLGLGSFDRKHMHAHTQLAIAASSVNLWYATARGNSLLESKLQARPGASNLFGILGIQIARVIARSDQIVVCAGCDLPFRPKRPLSHGSRQYCSQCRKAKVPQRDASRDWRRRGRAKKTQHR